MAIVSASICVRSKNFSTCVSPIRNDLFSIKLSDKYVYDIGIDQSSTCTGIAIRSTDKDINIIIDVRRDCGDKSAFYRELKGILRGLVFEKNIRNVICEDPVPTKNKRYSSTVLLELRGRVEEWMESIPEFQHANFSSVYPQTWKSLIVDKSKGTNRSNNKACIADDICDIVPEFRKYMNVYASTDYDGFDAFGILAGYQRYAYTDDGLRLISGKMEKRHKSFVGYKYLPISEVNHETINAFMGNAVNILKPVFLVYNNRYNVSTNVRMASSNWDCSYTIMPSEQIEVLKWKYDIDVRDDYALIAWIFNLSHYPQITCTSIKGAFDMQEEIKDC